MRIKNLEFLKIHIRTILQERNISIKQASEEIGIFYTTLYDFLFRERNITIYNLEAICSYCDIDICFVSKKGGKNG